MHPGMHFRRRNLHAAQGELYELEEAIRLHLQNQVIRIFSIFVAFNSYPIRFIQEINIVITVD